MPDQPPDAPPPAEAPARAAHSLPHWMRRPAAAVAHCLTTRLALPERELSAMDLQLACLALTWGGVAPASTCSTLLRGDLPRPDLAPELENLWARLVGCGAFAHREPAACWQVRSTTLLQELGLPKGWTHPNRAGKLAQELEPACELVCTLEAIHDLEGVAWDLDPSEREARLVSEAGLAHAAPRGLPAARLWPVGRLERADGAAERWIFVLPAPLDAAAAARRAEAWLRSRGDLLQALRAGGAAVEIHWATKRGAEFAAVQAVVERWLEERRAAVATGVPDHVLERLAPPVMAVRALLLRGGARAIAEHSPLTSPPPGEAAEPAGVPTVTGDHERLRQRADTWWRQVRQFADSELGRRPNLPDIRLRLFTADVARLHDLEAGGGE